MTKHRFDVEFRPADQITVRCGDLAADSERKLARMMVEADAIDGPIEGGRPGKLDWTFPSLHRFAVGAVKETEDCCLHPALQSAVVARKSALAEAKKARKVSAIALAVCLSLSACKPSPAYAAPPAGSDPNSPAAEWFRSLKDVRGISCCDASDCRRTMVRPREDGGIEAWVGVEEYGDGAPNAWVRVPDEEVKSRGNRPPGVRGAVACYYGARVACVDLEDGS